MEAIFRMKSKERQEGGFCCYVGICWEAGLFKGHFPGQPVAPGVCLLGLVKEALAQELGMPLRYQQIKDCKFLFPVTPALQGDLRLACKVEGQDGPLLKVTALLETADKKVMKLKASLARS